jgi:hypothetical protein
MVIDGFAVDAAGKIETHPITIIVNTSIITNIPNPKMFLFIFIFSLRYLVFISTLYL